MSNFLLPHPPATPGQMRKAVAEWRAAAAHERFRVAHGLCCGFDGTARHNEALYDRVADEIQAELDQMEATHD